MVSSPQKRVVALVVLGSLFWLVSSFATDIQVLYQDNFVSEQSGWKVDHFWSYANGEYRAFLSESGSALASALPAPHLFGLEPFCAQVDVRLLKGSGLAQDGFVGFYLAGRADNPNNFPSNAVLIGLDSFNRLLVLESFFDQNQNRVDTSIVMAVDNAFNDLSQFHTLLIAAHNNQVSVVLNGQFFGTANLFGITGEMGLTAFSFEDQNLNARFDNVRITDFC